MNVEQFETLLFKVISDMSITLPKSVSLDTPFNIIEVDSLARLELFERLEDLLEIRIQDEELVGVRTPRDLLTLINSRSAAKP